MCLLCFCWWDFLNIWISQCEWLEGAGIMKEFRGWVLLNVGKLSILNSLTWGLETQTLSSKQVGTGLSCNNSVAVSDKPECTPSHVCSFISGRAWFHSHLILCMGFWRQEEAWCPQDWAGCSEAAGGCLFHGAVLCRWTENVSRALPGWCLESERAVRCLNPCWMWECICCDGFAEYCPTYFLEKKRKYFYRSWSF